MKEDSVASTDKDERPPKSMTWFEIFYDITIAVALARAGDVMFEDPSWSAAVLVFAGIVVLFLVWLLTSLLYSVVPDDPLSRKLMLLLQGLLLIVAALATGRDGIDNWIGFAATAVALFITWLLYKTARANKSSTDRSLRRLSNYILLAALLFFASAVISALADFSQAEIWVSILFFSALVTLLVPTLGSFLKDVHDDDEIDLDFVQERFQELILIIVGEMSARLVVALGSDGEITSPGFFILTFLSSFSIWVVYTAGVTSAGIPVKLKRIRIWILAHAFFFFAAVAIISSMQEFEVTDFAAESDQIVEWTPLPFVLLFVSILIMMASQRVRGKLATDLPKARSRQWRQSLSNLQIEQRLVLLLQSMICAIAIALWALYYLAPIAGVPWYSVVCILLLIVNAGVLAGIAKVR